VRLKVGGFALGEGSNDEDSDVLFFDLGEEVVGVRAWGDWPEDKRGLFHQFPAGALLDGLAELKPPTWG